MAAAHAELIKEVEKGVRLKRAMSLDRSAPVIEAAQLHGSVHALLLHELASKTTNVGSNGHQLRHVAEDATRDKSAPIIEGGVRVKKSEREALKQEIEGGNASLRHIEVTDKSAPLLPSPPPAPAAVAALMESISDSPSSTLLRHVADGSGDRSAPVIEADVHVGKAEMPQVLAELKSRKQAV
eukprot:jgi/Chlat1/6802/Chrsp51S06506